MQKSGSQNLDSLSSYEHLDFDYFRHTPDTFGRENHYILNRGCAGN